MLKIKLPKPGGQDGAAQPAPSPSEPPTPSGLVRLKLKASQSFNANDQPASSSTAAPAEASNDSQKKKPGPRKSGEAAGPKGTGRKRAAEDSAISPAAKRLSSGPLRKLSLKINTAGPAGESGPQPRPRIALAKRKSSLPKFVDIRAKGQPPPRPAGVGYDSEDSETEKDPAIQQGLVLRMQPGEDADYLREAIANGKIGPHISQGDAEVSMKFIEPNYRRAIIRIRKRMYGAVLVELPCIVETMKSFDRKGWWKVTDVSQMLLVLGQVRSEEEARNLPLPREVNKENFQFAHGLTPPLHWVRKRRFRKRLNYNQIANVEEEVERLLAADRQYTDSGGASTFETMTREQFGRNQEAQYAEDIDEDIDEDAEGDAIETTEMDGQEYDDAYDDAQGEDGDVDAAALEAQMMAEFNTPDAQTSNEFPLPIVDQAASMAAVEHALGESSEGATPAEGTQDEESDEDESDEDDADSPDVVDEDAAARAAERAQQLEEVADLEREVDRARQKVAAMTNQLLRTREAQKLKQLEEDLRVKRGVFGLDEDDDEGGD